MNAFTLSRGRQFVATSIHERVQEAVEFAVLRRAVSLVVGRPGNEKTTSVRHIAEGRSDHFGRE